MSVAITFVVSVSASNKRLLSKLLNHGFSSFLVGYPLAMSILHFSFFDNLLQSFWALLHVLKHGFDHDFATDASVLAKTMQPIY